MRVTRIDGSVVNIKLDYNATPGDVDKNGHRIFTNDEEVLDFIDGIDLEPIVSNSNTLEDEASKLLND